MINKPLPDLAGAFFIPLSVIFTSKQGIIVEKSIVFVILQENS